MSILIVVAHPDDEVLGCGGTIAKLANKGQDIHVLFVADGVSSRFTTKEITDEIAVRKNAAKEACNILGVKTVAYGDLPDNQLDSVPLLDIVKRIEVFIQKYSPTMILTHHVGDLNIDHQCVSKAVITASRPQHDYSVKTVMSFEIPSSTEWQFLDDSLKFTPNWFVDITEFIDIKIKALNAYKQELREWPHPRSIKGVKHLANWRGSVVGVDSAEAFVLNRNIE